MIVLGIESSCDETSCAVVKNGKVLSNLIYSQIEHFPFGGVVPEIASRAHIKKLVPLLQAALDEAGLTVESIEGVGATKGPGLIGSLLIGLSFAKSFAYARGIPFYGVNHLEGHIFGTLVDVSPNFPALGFIISGGHTHLYYIPRLGSYKLIGKTRDDAAGEAFDKVAKALGLGYPGGPIIDKLSQGANPEYHRFTSPMRGKGLDLSFSGLKTSFIYFVQSLSKSELETHLNDILASFQMTVVETLIEKLLEASRITGTKELIIAGGVACNSLLRRRLEALKDEGYNVYLPLPMYATDNAAMIALCAEFHLKRGERSGFDLPPEPYAPLENLL